MSQLLLQNTRLGADNNLLIREISLVPDGGFKKLIVKVAKENAEPLFGKTLLLRSVLSISGQTVIAELSTTCTPAYDPTDFYVFISEPLNPAITIQQVLGLRLS